MNIEIMRYVDYWVGLPLCFLLSSLNYILRIINFGTKRENTPQKILFIKLSELGAIILAYPLLKRVKEQYITAELFFVTFEKNRSIFTLLGKMVSDKNTLTIREDSLWLFTLDTLKVIRKLRQEKIDIIFDLDFFSRFTAILAYLIRSDKRIGFYHYTFEGLYRGNLLTHKIQYNPLSHISKSYLSMSQVIIKEGKNTPELEERMDNGEIKFPKYISKSEIKERVYRKLKEFGIDEESRLFLLNPGEGILPLREWPLNNFILLSKWLLEDNKNYVVIIGTGGAVKKGETILRTVNNSRCISLIGQISLEELAELFDSSAALISNDCGLAHLAMLTLIKKFIIFGPESPQVFGPLGENNWIIYSNLPCSPCLSIFNHRNSVCGDNKCLKSIMPDEVYGLIRKSLKINH